MILALLAALQVAVDHQATVHIQGRPVSVRNVKGADASSCTVVVEGQRIPTYGHGELDAYRCARMVAAGRLDPRDGHERIGLIYDVGGSPTVDFRTALVFERVGGRWRIEPGSEGAHDGEAHAASIAALRGWERSGNAGKARR